MTHPPQNPPPAPDWILGEDGHWRPPPFTKSGFGAAPGGAAGAAPQRQPVHGELTQNQSAWDPSTPYQAAPQRGQGPGGSAPSVGPPPGNGGAKTVGVVLGALVVAGLGGLALLLGAVTFLGTTAPSEQTTRARDAASAAEGGASQPVAPGDGAGAPQPEDPMAIGPEIAIEDLTLSERAAWEMATQLQPEWLVVGGEPVELHARGSCGPQGWHDGATDRFRVGLRSPGKGEAEVRTIAYETDEQAQADLERARTDEYRECLAGVAQSVAGAEVTGEELPVDPTVPGVTYRFTGGGVVQDHTFIVVGQVRAYLTFCTCESLDESARHALAQEVAQAIARSQGLPDPV